VVLNSASRIKFVYGFFFGCLLTIVLALVLILIGTVPSSDVSAKIDAASDTASAFAFIALAISTYVAIKLYIAQESQVQKANDQWQDSKNRAISVDAFQLLIQIATTKKTVKFRDNAGGVLQCPALSFVFYQHTVDVNLASIRYDDNGENSQFNRKEVLPIFVCLDDISKDSAQGLRKQSLRTLVIHLVTAGYPGAEELSKHFVDAIDQV
jgi:hypothetical protein